MPTAAGGRGESPSPESGLLGINPLGDELNLAYDAARSVNEKQLMLYYGIGKYISMNSREGFWGKGAIDAISERLEKELPGLKGFSARNLRNMRSFYEEWVTLDASFSIDQLNLADLPHHAPEKWELFKKYNARDVEVELAIQDRLSKYPVPDNIWDEYHLDQEINDRGIRIDRELVRQAILMQTEKLEFDDELVYRKLQYRHPFHH